MNKAFLYLFVFGSGALYAQHSKLVEWNLNQQKITALKTQTIPLSLLAVDSLNVGNSHVEYFTKQTDFKDVHSPKSTEGFKIQSERLVTLRDWKFYGNFSFDKFTEKQSGFTVMGNPNRENPYKIADSITNAQWSKQKYLLELKTISPEIFKNTKVGVEVRYEINNAARQVDPRPLDKSLDLNISPFLVYNIKQWLFAAGMQYTSYREDLHISLQNNQKPKNIYKLLGLGEYLYSNPILLSGSLNRIYQGDGFGFNVAFGRWMTTQSKVQLSFSRKKVDETATDGTTNPYTAGLHERTEQNFNITYENVTDNNQHFAEVGFKNINSDNTEFIQSLNPITQQYELVYSSIMHTRNNNKYFANYKVNMFKNSQMLWRLGIGMQYESINEDYASTQSNLELNSLIVHLSAAKFWKIRQSQFSLGWKGVYKKVGDNNFKYVSNNASTNFVALNITQPNFEFAITPFFENTMEVQWIFPKFKKSTSQLYLNVNYSNRKPLNTSNSVFNKTSNNYFNITLGLYN